MTLEQQQHEELAYYVRQAKIASLKAYYYKYLNPKANEYVEKYDMHMDEIWAQEADVSRTLIQIQLGCMAGRG